MLLRRQRASERREMSWLEIQATSFSEYFKQFPELYGKVNSIVYCGFTLLCFIHWSNAVKLKRFCVKSVNAVPFGYNFDPSIALVNVNAWSRIACEGLPRSEDLTRLPVRSKVVIIWINFAAINVCCLFVLSFFIQECCHRSDLLSYKWINFCPFNLFRALFCEQWHIFFEILTFNFIFQAVFDSELANFIWKLAKPTILDFMWLVYLALREFFLHCATWNLIALCRLIINSKIAQAPKGYIKFSPNCVSKLCFSCLID